MTKTRLNKLFAQHEGEGVVVYLDHRLTHNALNDASHGSHCKRSQLMPSELQYSLFFTKLCS